MLQLIRAYLSNVLQVEFLDLVLHPGFCASMRLRMVLQVRPLAAGTRLHPQRSWFFQPQLLQPTISVPTAGFPKMLLELFSPLQAAALTLRLVLQSPLHCACAGDQRCPRNPAAVLRL